MAVRKLKLIWQQVNDSTSHLYQPWSFLNIDKSRKIFSNNINSLITTNDLHNVFGPSSISSISSMASSSISIMNGDQSVLINPPSSPKPLIRQTPGEATNAFGQTSTSMQHSTLDLLSKPPNQPNLETSFQSMKGKFIQKTRLITCKTFSLLILFRK